MSNEIAVDIVVWLQDASNCLWHGQPPIPDNLLRAAAEIERLRVENVRLRKIEKAARGLVQARDAVKEVLDV